MLRQQHFLLPDLYRDVFAPEPMNKFSRFFSTLDWPSEVNARINSSVYNYSKPVDNPSLFKAVRARLTVYSDGKMRNSTKIYRNRASLSPYDLR